MLGLDQLNLARETRDDRLNIGVKSLLFRPPQPPERNLFEFVVPRFKRYEGRSVGFGSESSESLVPEAGIGRPPRIRQIT